VNRGSMNAIVPDALRRHGQGHAHGKKVIRI
jgi:hypothetical protein